MKKENLKLLVIHCTATPQGRPVSKEQIIDMHLGPMIRHPDKKIIYLGKEYDSLEDVPEKMRNKRGRGWRVPGYADMIDLEGKVTNIVPYNDDEFVDAWEITNGAKGINGMARHVVYVGGTQYNNTAIAKDTRTAGQRASMESYVKNFIEKHPDAQVAGHNQFANKDCPSFNVPKWLRSIGIAEENIYEELPAIV